MLPVQELPHIDAGGVQAKTVTGIGVEENGPVVKLLPEHDVRVRYGFVSGVQRRYSPYRLECNRYANVHELPAAITISKLTPA